MGAPASDMVRRARLPYPGSRLSRRFSTLARHLHDTDRVTYDLFILPVDRAMTFAEASAEVERLQRGLGFRRGHDATLDPFIAALGRRYWQVRARTPIAPPFEFDVARSYIFVGIPWSRVEEVLAAVAEAAFESGVAVIDPQRELIGLPSAFAEAPLTTEGTDVHVRKAEEAFAAVGRGLMASPMDDQATAARNVAEELRESGLVQRSPLGFDITPDIADEVAADPLRVPSVLQTEEHRDELIEDLGGTSAPDRHLAIAQLAGWDPDPAVASALRPLLASDDVFEASQAATGIARQGDITDLPALLEVVHRLSPADGANPAMMIAPLRAALALAEQAGTEIVQGVRSRARDWRAAGGSRRPAWDHEADAELDEILGD